MYLCMYEVLAKCFATFSYRSWTSMQKPARTTTKQNNSIFSASNWRGYAKRRPTKKAARMSRDRLTSRFKRQFDAREIAHLCMLPPLIRQVCSRSLASKFSYTTRRVFDDSHNNPLEELNALCWTFLRGAVSLNHVTLCICSNKNV